MSETELLASEPENTVPVLNLSGRKTGPNQSNEATAMVSRFVEILDQKLTTFKRSFDEREEQHATEIKKA